jgi:hypothetical protein
VWAGGRAIVRANVVRPTRHTDVEKLTLVA